MTSIKLAMSTSKATKKIDAAIARAKDLTPAMEVAADDLTTLIRLSLRDTASPDGSAWPKLEVSTLNARKKRGGKKVQGPVRQGERRGGIGLVPLAGDTAALRGQMYVNALPDGIVAGNRAKSKDGFAYWLSHQFGAIREGYYKTKLKRSYTVGKKGEPRRKVEYFVNNKNVGAFRQVIPARAFMPFAMEGGKVTKMTSGPAAEFFEGFKKMVNRYISTGKLE